MTGTGCARTESGLSYSRPRQYQVDSETRLAIDYITGWCFDCDGMRHIEDLSLERALGALRRAARTLKSATAKRRWRRTGWECRSYHPLDQGINSASEFHTENWHALGTTREDQADRLVFLSQ